MSKKCDVCNTGKGYDKIIESGVKVGSLFQRTAERIEGEKRRRKTKNAFKRFSANSESN